MDLLERLGLGGRRVLILHHDDLGLTHAQNGAYQALGLPTGSVMVPGAWASGVKGEDLGVHLVLTSEWPAPRMRPLTEGESLRDEAGYFPESLEALWRKARAEEVERELKAQIQAAAKLFSPTHLDAHQGAVLRPDLAEVYLRPEERLGFYLDLAHLPPGLYYLVHHSALPTPEGRALPDWPTREADYFALSHPEVRRVLAEFHPLTWRAVREALF